MQTSSRHGGGRLRMVAILLLMLAVSPARLSRLRDEDGDDGEYEADWQPEVQVEETKKSWITELTENLGWTDEAADLIDEIQSRTSSSGLQSLKAACKAMCPKCICGVILLPSLPAAQFAKTVKPKAPAPPAKLKKPAEKPKKPAKKPAKKQAKKPEKPKKTPAKPTKAPAKPTKAPATPTKKPEAPKVTARPKPPPPPPTKEAIKKAKKWLDQPDEDQVEKPAARLESQLPDFMLDEDENDNANKREVDDHDPLSQSRQVLSYLGVE